MKTRAIIEVFILLASLSLFYTSFLASISVARYMIPEFHNSGYFVWFYAAGSIISSFAIMMIVADKLDDLFRRHWNGTY